MEKEISKSVIFIMGVSGSGKSTIGHLLSRELSIPFIDADDHHPESNIEKMSQGIPLNDSDRMPWLKTLNKIAIEHLRTGCVIACSALKVDYRSILNQSLENNVFWVYLKGSYDLINERMNNRVDHYMEAAMLKSQFDALEEPDDVLTIDIANSLDYITERIKSQIV